MRLPHAIVVVFAAIAAAGAQKPDPLVCNRCAWKPPVAQRIVDVRTVDELMAALDPSAARSGDAILLADGTYSLRRMLDVRTPRVTIRGRSGNPGSVVLRGDGMAGDRTGVALSISAADVTVADITIRDVGYHAVQVRGEAGASRFTLHNTRLLDAGQQLLKASVAGNGRFADDALIACSEFSYTSHAPSTYTNGMSLLGVRGWTIRDNTLSRIRGPQSEGWKGGPAILVWAGSDQTTVERNVVVDSFRGIALGLGAPQSIARNASSGLDHHGGLISQNVVVNLNGWADEGIEVTTARGVRIEHNTVFVEGTLPWSISARFPATTAQIRNNLTNRRVQLRDGATAAAEGNVTGALRAWFVDVPRANLRLTNAATAAVDRGIAIPGLALDFDREPRTAGGAPDAGAFERRPVR